MRIKKDVLIFLIFSVFSTAYSLCFELSIVAFLVAAVQCIFVLKRAKVSIFSLVTFLVNYSLLQQLIAYEGGEVYGLLNLGLVPIFYFELFFCVAVFNTMVYWLIQQTDVLYREINVYQMKLNVGYAFSILLGVAAIAITVLIFPSLPSLTKFSVNSRFSQGYLPFTGWSCVPFFFLAVGLMNEKARKEVFICAVFVMVWYVFHGERIDAISLLLFILAKYYYEHADDRRSIYRLSAVLIAAVFVFLAVGVLRKGGSADFATLIKKLVVQDTACDVVYVFNCAVELNRRGISYGGSTFLSYLVNCIPMLNDPYNFAICISEYYYTLGGGLLFAEPIANFGLWFVPVYSLVFLLLLCFPLVKINKYTTMIYMELFLSAFRLIWYGLNYPIVTILYFVPFVFLGDKLFSKKLVFNHRRRRGVLWR